jgi:hypothetical protein
MIRFECQHCGHKLKVPDERSGRQGRCPACKGIVTVPAAPLESSLTEDIQLVPADTARAGIGAALDLPQREYTDEDREEAGREDRRLLTRLGIEPLPEYTGERKLPWPIDILLYPANLAGLASLGVIVGVPLVLSLLSLVLWVIPFVGLLFFLAGVLIWLYAAWYFAECVYDSARGGTRAPQGLDTGGTGDMWERVSYVLAVWIIFVVPMVVYFLATEGRKDAILWGLVAWAVIFFPMGLLAMVINDSLSALNPFFLLGSILRVFFPYVGFVLLLGTFAAGLAWLTDILPPVINVAARSYGGLVLAHILGRFYWRHRERLDWGL